MSGGNNPLPIGQSSEEQCGCLGGTSRWPLGGHSSLRTDRRATSTQEHRLRRYLRTKVQKYQQPSPRDLELEICLSHFSNNRSLLSSPLTPAPYTHLPLSLWPSPCSLPAPPPFIPPLTLQLPISTWPLSPGRLKTSSTLIFQCQILLQFFFSLILFTGFFFLTFISIFFLLSFFGKSL